MLWAEKLISEKVSTSYGVRTCDRWHNTDDPFYAFVPDKDLEIAKVRLNWNYVKGHQWSCVSGEMIEGVWHEHMIIFLLWWLAQCACVCVCVCVCFFIYKYAVGRFYETGLRSVIIKCGIYSHGKYFVALDHLHDLCLNPWNPLINYV